DFLTVCQLTGEITMLDSTLDAPRALDVLDTLLALAERHRLDDQRGRLIGFKASLARQGGSLLLERALRTRAVDPSTGVATSGQKVRALLQLMKLLGDLDCWAAMRVQSHRTALYLSKLERSSRTFEHDVATVSIELLRGEALLADGRGGEAWPV